MDYEDDDEFDGPRPFPTLVRIAGILWIAFGVIGVCSAIAGFAMQGGNANAGAGGGPNPASNCCGILIPAAFLYVGIQTVQGKATDTLGNGIGSLVFGLIYLAVAGACFVMGNKLLAGAGGLAMFVGLVVAVFAGMLIGAGTMALVSRQEYKDWRRENRPRKRPRRNRDDNDDDDRPRRRRRDEENEDDLDR